MLTKQILIRDVSYNPEGLDINAINYYIQLFGTNPETIDFIEVMFIAEPKGKQHKYEILDGRHRLCALRSLGNVIVTAKIVGED